MILVDIILAALFLGFIGMGLKDGCIHTLGRFLGAIVGFVVARAWSVRFALWLGVFLPSGWARIVAFVIIFLVVTRLVGWIFKLVDGLFNIVSIIPFVTSINRLLGALLGAVEGLIVLGGVIYIVRTFSLEPHLIQWLAPSKVANALQTAFQTTLGVLL
jgi:uncharacterized membrane protein required for colicin V production